MVRVNTLWLVAAYQILTAVPEVADASRRPYCGQEFRSLSRATTCKGRAILLLKFKVENIGGQRSPESAPRNAWSQCI